MASRLLAPTASPALFAAPRPRAVVSQPRPSVPASRRASVTTCAAPVTWSISSYDEIIEEKYKCQILKQCAVGLSANTPVSAFMPTDVTTTHPKAKLTELEPHFARITGMPVVGKDNVLLGVVSKKDLRATFDHTTTVAEVMSSPAIAIQPHNTIIEAACLMLKYKVHRLPVVNDEKQVVGIVTQNDIFGALGIFS